MNKRPVNLRKIRKKGRKGDIGMSNVLQKKKCGVFWELSTLLKQLYSVNS